MIPGNRCTSIERARTDLTKPPPTRAEIAHAILSVAAECELKGVLSRERRKRVLGAMPEGSEYTLTEASVGSTVQGAEHSARGDVDLQHKQTGERWCVTASIGVLTGTAKVRITGEYQI